MVAITQLVACTNENKYAMVGADGVAMQYFGVETMLTIAMVRFSCVVHVSHHHLRAMLFSSCVLSHATDLRSRP